MFFQKEAQAALMVACKQTFTAPVHSKWWPKHFIYWTRFRLGPISCVSTESHTGTYSKLLGLNVKFHFSVKSFSALSNIAMALAELSPTQKRLSTQDPTDKVFRKPLLRHASMKIGATKTFSGVSLTSPKLWVPRKPPNANVLFPEPKSWCFKSR